MFRKMSDIPEGILGLPVLSRLLPLVPVMELLSAEDTQTRDDHKKNKGYDIPYKSTQYSGHDETSFTLT